MIDEALRIARLLIGDRFAITREELEETIGKIVKLDDRFSSLNREDLIRALTYSYAIRDEKHKLIQYDNMPWIKDKKASINWKYWNRYKAYLQDKKGFAFDTIRKLDDRTDDILDCLFDPSEKNGFDKKGLVVGQVQSGKTSNYTGLICKAADSGFNLIIVLAGIHNNLRSQTQLRLDEGFLGRPTIENNTDIKVIGVGEFDPTVSAHSLTTSPQNGDFTSNSNNVHGLDFATNSPILAVVKKNPSVLKRLFNWLSSQAIPTSDGKRLIKNKSLLLIDDEADNASINISNDPEKRSSINDWITKTLGLFEKRAYVGYTATPFANIFIPLDKDNLFPRNFIFNIPAPSNYIGPEKVFGKQLMRDVPADQLPDEYSNDVLPIVVRVDDYKDFVPDKHKQGDQLPSNVPDSLKTAIRCFIITCAIKRARGQQGDHNSMLIHVSRFQKWQDHITELVKGVFDYYRMGIDQNDRDILDDLRKTFEENSGNYKSYPTITEKILNSSLKEIDPFIRIHQWSEIKEQLHAAASKIVVKAIHGGSAEALDYNSHKNGLSVIAVGGNKLSRGLTLEGLSVSYYLRASKMYDTLMQMGRWFGYRLGYTDLCRLFISRELNEWFCHVTYASEELREEFDHMWQVAGSTPEKYALKIRTLPGTLLISSINKLKQKIEFDLSYSGRLIQTTVLYPRKTEAEYNYKVLTNFLSSVGSEPNSESHLIYKNVSAALVVDNFLSLFKYHPDLTTIDQSLLKKYILDSNANLELTNWTIAVLNSQNQKGKKHKLLDKYNLTLTERNAEENTSTYNDNLLLINNSQVISPKHEYLDLQEFPNNLTGRAIRAHRNPQNALLMIYLLDPAYDRVNLDHDIPLVSFAISFPNSPSNVKVRYAAHKQLREYLDWEDDNDDQQYEEN